MGLRLHRGRRFRAWLGARLGGDHEVGDRAWRRILHGLGAAVLLYYAFPDGFFVIAPKREILLAVLAVVLAIEVGRLAFGLELPTIRPYETGRLGSYVFYSIALAGAVLLFPVAIAGAVVLGTALVDPVIGELRGRPTARRLYPALPFALYTALAVVGLYGIGHWPWLTSLALAPIAAALALASERPKLRWLDDDLTMTFVPALALYGLGVVVAGLP